MYVCSDNDILMQKIEYIKIMSQLGQVYKNIGWFMYMIMPIYTVLHHHGNELTRYISYVYVANISSELITVMMQYSINRHNRVHKPTNLFIDQQYIASIYPYVHLFLLIVNRGEHCWSLYVHCYIYYSY